MMLISQAPGNPFSVLAHADWCHALRAAAADGHVFGKTYHLAASKYETPVIDGVRQALPDAFGGYTAGGFVTPGRAIPQAEAEALADVLERLLKKRRIALPDTVLPVLRAGAAVEIAP